MSYPLPHQRDPWVDPQSGRLSTAAFRYLERLLRDIFGNDQAIKNILRDLGAEEEDLDDILTGRKSLNIVSTLPEQLDPRQDVDVQPDLGVEMWREGQMRAIAQAVFSQSLGGPVSAEEVIQIGDIWPSGRTAHPKGLLCDGAGYDVSEKSALFNAIGYSFGGSGSTFNVPDLRGKYATGADGDVGSEVGANTVDIAHQHAVDLTTDAAPDHQHSMAHTHQIDPPQTTSGGPNQLGALGGNLVFGPTVDHTHTVDIPQFTSSASSASQTGPEGGHTHQVVGDTGGSLGQHDNRPASVAVNYFIRWQ